MARSTTIGTAVVSAFIGGVAGKAVSDWIDADGWLWPLTATGFALVWLAIDGLFIAGYLVGKGRRNRVARERARDETDSGSGFEARNGQGLHIIGGSFSNNAGHGIHLKGDMTGVEIDGVSAEGNDGDGLRFEE